MNGQSGFCEAARTRTHQILAFSLDVRNCMRWSLLKKEAGVHGKRLMS